MRIFSIAILALLFAHCGRSNAHIPFAAPRIFISGVYSYYEASKFYAVWDTIIISKRKGADRNIYAVTRSSEFQGNVDAEYLPAEQSKKHWTAVYDNLNRSLTSINGGPEITFHPFEDTLMLNGTRYTRVE